ncbi:hypothetical protein RC62_918 [Flavobacterium aquidurense]|uniref:Uncharacterized protein n=1 Tax=Flavobacterium aquidurense TaxID=362413 RepID=A0A0Q0XSS7_9FLAO|nr:hypothetical protein RC62_918 [Flavobacterium aquidurense]
MLSLSSIFNFYKITNVIFKAEFPPVFLFFLIKNGFNF